MSKALVPRDEKTQSPSDRRRLLGFVLLIIAAFILLPELKQEQSSSESIQSRPSLEAWNEPPDMFEAPTEIVPQKVITASLDDDFASAWSDDYEEEPARESDVTRLQAATSDVASVLQTGFDQNASQQHSAGQAFMVQVGIFKNETNAKDLVKKLDNFGFRSFIKTQNEFHKVLIGPQLRRQEAETALASLAQKLDMKGLIKNYSP